MKKVYQTPLSENIKLAPAEMLAASKLDGLGYDNSGSIDAESDLLSNRHGWNSDAWTGGLEDEE